MQLPPEKASLFGMLHCALNTTAENLDLITRLGLQDLGRFPSLKFSDVRIYDCSTDILDIPCLSKIESPAEETDAYLRSLFTRTLCCTTVFGPSPEEYRNITVKVTES